MKIFLFSAEDLCELLPGSEARPPRFYRVSQKDELVFPQSTFASLKLDEVNVQEDNLQVSWNIKLDYYYTDYDWGLIFREIGGDKTSENMFFKTRYNLKSHLEANSDWTPKSENLTAIIGGLLSDHYYEVCLAVVEHVTVYYIHRDLCREIRTLKPNNGQLVGQSANIQSAKTTVKNLISTKNVTIVPSHNSITLTWQIDIEDEASHLKEEKSDMISVIRQISVRKFGSDNATQLFVLEDFNKTALLKESNRQDAESSR